MNVGDTMERSLALVLNGREDNKLYLPTTISLTLETMESKELDDYISKNFESSEDVRAKYNSKITSFLEQHKSLIETVEKNTGRKFRGSIVITELGGDLTLERKKVLYKKDIILFQEIIKNKKFLLALNARDYINYNSALKERKPYIRIFPEYYSRELHFRCTNENQFKRILSQWQNMLKDSLHYYDIIRRVLKEYESRHLELKLDSLDVIYSKYKNSIKQQELTKEEMLNTNVPTRYRSYADEDGYQGDLDFSGHNDIEEDSQTLGENENIKTKSKTKSLKYPGQYSWFSEGTE